MITTKSILPVNIHQDYHGISSWDGPRSRLHHGVKSEQRRDGGETTWVHQGWVTLKPRRWFLSFEIQGVIRLALNTHFINVFSLSKVSKMGRFLSKWIKLKSLIETNFQLEKCEEKCYATLIIALPLVPRYNSRAPIFFGIDLVV